MILNIFFSITIFLSAACGLIVEIVAGRLLAPIFGMSLYTWTSIISVVLAGLSIGHWIGGVLTHYGQTSKRQYINAGVALILACFASLLILPLATIFPGFIRDQDFGIVALILGASFGLFFLPSLFVGIVSPIVTNLAVNMVSVEKTGLIIGRMYALGSFGAIFGALFSGYFLISSFGTRLTIIFVAVTYACLGVLFFIIGKKKYKNYFISLLFVGIISTWFSVKYELIKTHCLAETNYFCVKIDDIGPNGSDVRLMALDHLVHSINDRDNPQLLHAPYIHFVDEYIDLWISGDRAPKAYMIGGGGFTLPRAWIEKYAGHAELLIAEIDPKVTDLAKKYLWFEPIRSKTSVIHQDARYTLQNEKERSGFDLIFGDAFHDIAIPQHLVTQEFNEVVKSHLNDKGIYIVNVVDDSNRPMFLVSFVKTLDLTFSNVQVWFQPNIYLDGGRVTYSVVASNSKLNQDIIHSKRGFERIWWLWPSKKIRNSYLYQNLPILSDDLAPIDLLMSGLILAKPDYLRK